MTISDLTDIFQMFGYGLAIGGIFSGTTFLTGYFINFIIELTK